MTKPRKYQRQGVRKMLWTFKGRALLADEMGLGKSFQALLVAKKAGLYPTIIVCPAFLKWNWERECSMHIGVRAEVLEGTKPPKQRRLISRSNVIIINFDILPHWWKVLRRLKPQLIVLDEIHYAKNKEAKRTKACKALCKGVPHVLCLGGTPLTNRPIELWVPLNLLRPDVFSSFREFAHYFCKPEWTPWGWQFKGASHSDELHKLMKETCMVRRLKSQVLKELPPKSRFVIPMSIPRRREYEEALNNFILWLRKKHPRKARRAVHAEQLVKVGYLKRLVAELKLKSVVEWIENYLEEGKKLIVFAIHRKIINLLHETFDGKSVVVDGSITGHKRQLAIDKFQTKKETRLLIGQLQAAGVGWNGTAASAVAFAELGWTPGEHIQAEDRIHRIGQLNATSIYYLVGRDTVEDKLCKILHDKQKVLTATLDGDVSVDGVSVLDELIQDLKKKGK